MLSLVVLVLTSLTYVRAQGGPENAWSLVYDAYMAVRDAESSGGNVTGLVSDLNRALTLIDEGIRSGNSSTIDEAKVILSSVIDKAPLVKEAGEAEARARMLTAIAVCVLAAVGLVAAYAYGRDLPWRLWLRLRGRYRLRATGRGGGRSMILDEEVRAVIAAIVIVAVVFAVSQAVLAGRVVEPFSELGVLGPKRKIGDYPKQVLVGDRILLHVYVGNHMGKTMVYEVQVKIGDNSTPVDPAPLDPVLTYHVALKHNESLIFPVTLALNDTGRKRILFELWILNETTGTFTYHHRWCQIWVDVIPPPSL